MGKLELTLKDEFRRVRRAVEEEFRLRVYVGDILDPNTRTFDGSEIGIDNGLGLGLGLEKT